MELQGCILPKINFPDQYSLCLTPEGPQNYFPFSWEKSQKWIKPNPPLPPKKKRKKKNYKNKTVDPFFILKLYKHPTKRS